MFNVIDPSIKRLSIVLQGKHVLTSAENHDLTLDIFYNSSFTTHVCTVYEENDSDDVHDIYYDHQEGE